MTKERSGKILLHTQKKGILSKFLFSQTDFCSFWHKTKWSDHKLLHGGTIPPELGFFSSYAFKWASLQCWYLSRLMHICFLILHDVHIYRFCPCLAVVVNLIISKTYKKDIQITDDAWIIMSQQHMATCKEAQNGSHQQCFLKFIWTVKKYIVLKRSYLKLPWVWEARAASNSLCKRSETVLSESLMKSTAFRTSTIYYSFTEKIRSIWKNNKADFPLHYKNTMMTIMIGAYSIFTNPHLHFFNFLHH